MKEQRRGRRIAMTPEEIGVFLTSERMCRIGTVGGGGAPHVSPLWFVWDGEALWLNSIVKSQRWTNVLRDPRVSVVFDGGDGFFELKGIEMTGKVEVVGDVPRTTATQPSPEVVAAERLFADKYTSGRFVVDDRHAWLRLVPEKIVSWDHAKIQAS